MPGIEITANPQFNAARDRVVGEAMDLSPAAIQAMLRRLNDARAEIVTRIAAAPSGSFQAAQLARMRNEIDRVMSEYTRDAGRDLNQAQSQAYDFGARIVDQPMAAAGQNFVLGSLSRTTLETAQGYALKRLANVSAQTAEKIDEVLHRALLGGQSQLEVIQKIGRLLSGSDVAPSVFSETGQRAARIYFNEIQRMLDLGTQRRLEQYAERLQQIQPGATLPGYKPKPVMVYREWRHTDQEHPRMGHLLLNGQIKPVNEKFKNPNTGIDLMYPHDPDAPASETINCKCFLLPALAA